MAKKEKVSFLFYYDYLEQFKELTADEIIDMIKSIIDYEKEDIEPVYEDRTLRSVWNFIKRRLDIDRASYQKTCEKNKKIAEERWKRKILGEESTKSTTGTNGKKNVPRATKNTTGTNGKKNVPRATKNTDIDKDTHIDKDSFNNVCIKKEEISKEENSNFCHLGRDTKIESCQKCLKNKQCPLRTDSQFILEHSCDFEEWLAKQKSFADSIIKESESPPTEIELFDYDWLGDSND